MDIGQRICVSNAEKGDTCLKVQAAACARYVMDTFLQCVMFAKLLQFRSVLQCLTPELILS